MTTFTTEMKCREVNEKHRELFLAAAMNSVMLYPCQPGEDLRDVFDMFLAAAPTGNLGQFSDFVQSSIKDRAAGLTRLATLSWNIEGKKREAAKIAAELKEGAIAAGMTIGEAPEEVIEIDGRKLRLEERGGKMVYVDTETDEEVIPQLTAIDPKQTEPAKVAGASMLLGAVAAPKKPATVPGKVAPAPRKATPFPSLPSGAQVAKQDAAHSGVAKNTGGAHSSQPAGEVPGEESPVSTEPSPQGPADAFLDSLNKPTEQ
jgi:hypothetical protein